MEDKIQQLINLLEDAVQLLQSHGINHWADWLSEDITDLKKNDLRGIEHLLSAYGGMGSLNDVVIWPENGDKIQKSEVQKVNKHLSELRTAIYVLAKQIKN